MYQKRQLLHVVEETAGAEEATHIGTDMQTGAAGPSTIGAEGETVSLEGGKTGKFNS